MRRVGILFGGRSGEHDVSLRSAASVVHRLDRQEFEPVPIGITRGGAWFAQDTTRIETEAGEQGVLSIEENEHMRVSVYPSRGLSSGSSPLALDVVFPVLHGSFGEDGTVQGLLEVAELPYVGAGVLGSALGMDKEIAKRAWQQAGLPTVSFETLRREDLVDETDVLDDTRIAAAMKRIEETIAMPWFVKPGRAGSSVGVTRVETPQTFAEAVRAALSFDTKLLVEPEVQGREIEVSVVGTESVRTFPPGEIRPTHGFYSYEAKYIDPDGAALFVPAELPAETSRHIRSLAAKAYRAVDCEGFARIDFFLESHSGAPQLNEINTIPGFTSISMFPKLCEEGELPYDALLSELIRLALRRAKIKSALSYQWL
ncbi:MAG: D-alanine--D-alanine ligase family protein [Spirochaetia bacterium]